MAWERTGTVTVTNGSATVTGAGTTWAAPAVKPGYAFLGPDGVIYEISALNTATEITLAKAYGGSNGSGQSYDIQPTPQPLVELHDGVKDLIDTANAKIDPLEAWKTQTEADFQALLATEQAGFATLASDLKGVVNGQMYFTATVDPDDPAPTNVDGGTFNTIFDVTNAAPAGAFVDCSLIAGKSHDFGNHINTFGRKMRFKKSGAGNDPAVNVLSYANATHNYNYGFTPHLGGVVRFEHCDILFGDKTDVGLPWASTRNLISYTHGGHARLEIYGGSVTGFTSQSLMTANAGSIAQLSLYSTTLDGPITGVQYNTNGVALISHQAVTLLNGATLTESGTLGTHFLSN